MEPTQISSPYEPSADTIGDELDRLEIPAGKIGMITSAQAFALLHGLDSVYERMQDMEPDSSSHKIVGAQFDGIVARLQKEAGRFIRDLGGLHALQQARAEVKPPRDHEWWFLDEWLADKRRSAMKRSLIIAGGVVVAIILLAVLYNRFLAPDPQVAARYQHEQTAQDLMIRGDLQGALKEVDQGLLIPPEDPVLLVLKGVIQESLGQPDQAEQNFTRARLGFRSDEEFYMERGQDYIFINKADKALADAQAALKVNPNLPQAYLLIGQIYEVQQKYQDAMDSYNNAYTLANQEKQTDMAALARVRIAYLMQTINSQQLNPEEQGTPTP